MKFRSSSILANIIYRALLIAMCVLIAFGSAAHVLLPSLLPLRVLAANGSSPTHQSSLPEEAPSETPDSNEPVEEGEVSFFAVRRTSPKAARLYVQQSNPSRFSSGDLLKARALLVGSQTHSPQFEHCYRNGCGAHMLS